MDRKILFRGKRIDNGEWAYGFYVHVLLGRFGKEEHMIQTIHKDGKMAQLYDVNSETVGQFTGLTDKNGKKIFEGDILFDGVLNYTVKYSPCSCGFEAFGKGVDGIWSLSHLAHKGNCGREIEIIGNIHDNPELIGDPK